MNYKWINEIHFNLFNKMIEIKIISYFQRKTLLVKNYETGSNFYPNFIIYTIHI